MIGYKLVDQDLYSRRGEVGETRWGIGETVHPTGEGCEPCGPGVLHDYADPLLAVAMNPAHANIKNPRMLVLEHEVSPEGDGRKRWTTHSVQVLREEPLPEITANARVRWGILCAQSVLPDEAWAASWRDWAEAWLSGKDRSSSAAWAAAGEAGEAGEADAAMLAGAGAARAAMLAAAGAAQKTAWAAARSGKDLDLLALLKQAIADEAEYEKARAGCSF